MRKLGRLLILPIGLVVLATGCGLRQAVTEPLGVTEWDGYEVTWYQGAGAIPALEEVGCVFDSSEGPGEPLAPDIMAVIEWGGYESYGGRWIEPRDDPIVEGREQGPLIVAIVGDAAAFEQWLDGEPGRRETSGIDDVVEGEIPYCLVEYGYELLSTVPGMLEGGVTVNGGRPSVDVMVEAVADVELNSYPPFMRFAQWPDGITVTQVP